MSPHERGCTLRGWNVHTSLHRLSILGLVVLLLTGLSLPRFGLVWHDHDGSDDDHPDYQLLTLLASSQAPHPDHQAHHHTDTSHVSLSSADTANVHAHYVDASLLVFYCLWHPLTLTLRRVSLRPRRCRIFLARRIAPLPARAPPCSLLLTLFCCATRARGLSVAV